MISIIVAMGVNNEIGKDNKMLWHIPEELEHFKNITLNKKIIMGHKTLKSLNYTPLKNRVNILLSRNKDLIIDDIIVYNNEKDILKKYLNTKEEVFVIGGEKIYKIFLPYAKRLYVSYINKKYDDADVFFPYFNEKDYVIIKEENKQKYIFKIYEKGEI